MKNRALFLDKDGVIIESVVIDGKPYSQYSIQEIKLIDDIKELINYFIELEFIIIVCSNQPDISKGFQPKENIIKINEYIKSKLPINDFFICPHQDSDNCFCRKPKTGLFLDASKKYNIDLSQSFMIGDRKSDIDAGYNAGCKKTIFIDYNYNEEKPTKQNYTIKNVKEIIDIFKNKGVN